MGSLCAQTRKLFSEGDISLARREWSLHQICRCKWKSLIFRWRVCGIWIQRQLEGGGHTARGSEVPAFGEVGPAMGLANDNELMFISLCQFQGRGRHRAERRRRPSRQSPCRQGRRSWLRCLRSLWVRLTGVGHYLLLRVRLTVRANGD